MLDTIMVFQCVIEASFSLIRSHSQFHTLKDISTLTIIIRTNIISLPHRWFSSHFITNIIHPEISQLSQSRYKLQYFITTALVSSHLTTNIVYPEISQLSSSRYKLQYLIAIALFSSHLITTPPNPEITQYLNQSRISNDLSTPTDP